MDEIVQNQGLRRIAGYRLLRSIPPSPNKLNLISIQKLRNKLISKSWLHWEFGTKRIICSINAVDFWKEPYSALRQTPNGIQFASMLRSYGEIIWRKEKVCCTTETSVWSLLRCCKSHHRRSDDKRTVDNCCTHWSDDYFFPLDLVFELVSWFQFWGVTRSFEAEIYA